MVEVTEVFDVELIKTAQMMTPAVLGLVMAYVLRRINLFRRLLLIGVFVYVVYLAEVVIGFGVVSEKLVWVERLFEPNIEGIPTIDKHVADRYVAGRLGRENFNVLVTFDPQLSEHVNGAGRSSGYKVIYHFEPLREYQENDTFEVVVRNNQVESAYTLPNCLKDESLCQFEVGRDEVIEIVRRNGFVMDDVVIGTTTLVENNLAIEVKSCDTGKRMLIDYRDGNVIGTSDWVCE